MSERERLAACPFCPETTIPYVSQGRVSREGYSGPIWRVMCPRCGASSNSHDTENDAIAAWNSRHASAPPADVAPASNLLPRTAALVDAFAAALKAKLLRAQEKYGYQDGWTRDDWMAECQQHLAEHVAKGDPLDVAAYAAFCWHHGWSTKAADALAALARERDRLREAFSEMEQRKDDAYAERNKLVAWLARCYPSGIAKTAIEGWSDDWHGCVYIDLPTGQVSWHYHDSQAGLFLGLPAYHRGWDGHTTEQKYERLAALWDGYAADVIKRARAALGGNDAA